METFQTGKIVVESGARFMVSVTWVKGKSTCPKARRRALQTKRSVDQYLRYNNIAFQLFAAVVHRCLGWYEKLDAWLLY